jgi:hypothetical protein
MNTTTAAPTYSGGPNFLRRTEAWLDNKGRGAWIGAMVLGMIFFWPIGLALVFYITLTNRWSKSPMFARNHGACAARRTHWGHMQTAARSSGNAAFDAYKAETLRRLQDEQEAFEAFLQRLRDAKDKTEFDSFMDDRAKAARTAAASDAPVQPTSVERPGEY